MHVRFTENTSVRFVQAGGSISSRMQLVHA